MANKKISQLDPSTKNLRDTDYLECERHDGIKSYRYTLAQVRAVEKAEREDMDDAIIEAVGLDTDGSLIPFSGTNYVDDATDIADAITILDASIPSAILITKSIYTQLSSITVENNTKTYIIADSSGIEIPAEYLVAGKTIRVTIMGYYTCGTDDDADLSVYLYPYSGTETGILADLISNYDFTGNNPFVVNLDITIRTEGTSGTGYASGVVTLGGGATSEYTKSYYIASKGEFSVNTTVDNILALSYQYDTSIAANKTYINTGVVELI